MPRPMADGPGKRYPLSSRLTHETNEALRAAAKLSGRSVSQEAEFRLEKSLSDDNSSSDQTKDNLMLSALVDSDTAEMLRSIACVISASMAYTGKHWGDDVYTRGSVQAAMEIVRARHFGARSIECAPEEIDMSRLERAISTGRLFGKLLVAAQLDPDVSTWISGMVKTSQPRIDEEEEAADFAELSPARQDAALKRLMGVN